MSPTSTVLVNSFKSITSFLVWTSMLCYLSYHFNAEGPVCSLLPGSTMTGRLLGPKMALGIFLNDMWLATASGIESGFCNLSVTGSALYQLSCITAAISPLTDRYDVTSNACVPNHKWTRAPVVWHILVKPFSTYQLALY